MSTQTDVAVLISTRKGLFIARSDETRKRFVLEGPHMAGFEIQRAFLDPRWNGQRGFAAAHHPIWGIHVYRTDDGGVTWFPLDAVPSHGEDDGPDYLKTIWSLAPGPDSEPDTILAGIEPPGLFKSRDGGESWIRLEGFHTHSTASRWHPAKGGCAVHSVSAIGSTVYAALAAGGTYRSDDAGVSWQACNTGIRAPYLAEANARPARMTIRCASIPPHRGGSIAKATAGRGDRTTAATAGPKSPPACPATSAMRWAWIRPTPIPCSRFRKNPASSERRSTAACASTAPIVPAPNGRP